MSKTESFESLNELARAFRSGEKHARPQHTPVLEGIRAVLAHLHSAGRLIPAGGMALTAEQVENVQTAREALRGYRNFEGSISRGHVRGLIAAVDALFPATVPAEEVCQSVSIFGEHCAQRLGHVGRHAANGCAWGYPPAPAEPAEEETKARCPSEIAGWGCSLMSGHDGDHTALDQDGPAYVWPASSPVVPAPTETGPWQTWEAVPRGQTVRAANGERFRKNSVGAIHLLTNGVGDCCQVDTEANPLPAPFTAVEDQS